MTVLITSDLHFTDNPRDQYRFQIIDWLCSVIKKQNIKNLFVLGDLTEAKDKHSSWLVNEIVDGFLKLSDCCNVVIMRGNHDAVIPSEPFFAFLGKFPKITWINDPYKVKVAGLGSCLFLPHTTNYKSDWSDLSGHDWIFAHATFSGAKTESGYELDGIPVSIFPDDANVISGDIHKRQTIGPVTYVGSPYTVDFGDEFKPRVLVLDKNGMKSLACKGPQKRLVYAEVWDIDGFAVDQGKIPLQQGDILKIRVSIDRSQYDRWPEVRDALRQWGEDEGYVVNSVEVILEQVEKTVKRTVVSKPKSDKKVLQDYSKQQQVDDKTLRRGITLLNET